MSDSLAAALAVLDDFAVEFSRWRKDGTELSPHKSIYVVTRQDGHWGVQARSSFAA
jgi:hypothetical protein